MLAIPSEVDMTLEESISALNSALAEAVSTLEEFFDKFIWLSTPAHGDLPERAGAALKFLKEALQEWETYYNIGHGRNDDVSV